jgi:hypothetical protein
LLEIAYPTARVWVVLDAGDEIRPELADIARRHEGRVQTYQWKFREIEGFFATSAVRAWLAEQGVTDADINMEPHRSGKPKDYLHGLAHKYLRRRYRVDEDGRSIALLTRSADLDADVVEFLRRVTATADHDADTSRVSDA